MHHLGMVNDFPYFFEIHTKTAPAKPGLVSCSSQFCFRIDQQQVTFRAVPRRAVGFQEPVLHRVKPHPAGQVLRLFRIGHFKEFPLGRPVSSRIPDQGRTLCAMGDALSHFSAAIGANEVIIPFFHIDTPIFLYHSIPKLLIQENFLDYFPQKLHFPLVKSPQLSYTYLTFFMK